MATHTPFLREYIFGNNCIEELKQKIKNLEYKLKTVIADNQDLKKELEKLNELYKNGVLTQIEYNQKQEKYEQKITELKKNIS